MVLYSSSAEMSTTCSKECRENMMKFSEDRSSTWMIEKKSVGERRTMLSLREVMAKDPAKGQMS